MLRDAAPVEISLSPNEQEMEQFNSLPRVSKDVDVCQWWLQHSQTLPLLFNDARHVLGVAVSLSGSERVFSTCGRLDTSRRARLTSDSLLFRWFRLILTSPSSFGHLLKHFILLRLFRHEIISSVSFPIVPTSNIFLNYSIVSTDSTKSQKLISAGMAAAWLCTYYTVYRLQNKMVPWSKLMTYFSKFQILTLNAGPKF